MAQLEPQDKVLVSEEFLNSTHGEVACEQCHGGDGSAGDKESAHKGMEPHPSITRPEKACGECHAEIVNTAKNSLHATLSTFPTILKARSDMAKWEEIDKARAGHCAGCHTSCGGCHVSRPKFAKKGFVSGHVFQRRSDPVNQCTACHGSRIGNEYYGLRGQGDVHATKADMDCASCHGAREMHAAAPADLKGRYYLDEMVRCTDCHKDLEHGSVRDHAIHVGKVQCQVCHSQTYVNCYSCHTGMDAEGIRYFQNQREVEGMKIGFNDDPKAPAAGYRFMLTRHVPSDLEVFDFYLKDAFANFKNVPTWKRASPHNIRRKTWQAASCNHCHGNRALFLAESDLLDYEKEANRKIVVPDAKIPKAVEKTKPTVVDTGAVKKDMVVAAEWLHANLGKEGIVVIDVRGDDEYATGHIEGAASFNPVSGDIRNLDEEEERYMELVEDEDLLALLGNAGLAASDHIVVYDKDGRRAGLMLWVLEYAGASKVSYLDGGIEAWHEAGYHLQTEATELKPKAFGGQPRKEFVADNEYVQANLDNPRVIIVDTRIIQQAKGMSKHDKAGRAGHIPGSVNLPIGAFYMENGYLKTPEELLWMLREYGITPDKTVVTTCNTGQFAGDAFFVLRYLGFEKVKVHDASWIGWCAMK